MTNSATPCFCHGPSADADPADRPETTLGREHVTGAPGCDYWMLDRRAASAPMVDPAAQAAADRWTPEPFVPYSPECRRPGGHRGPCEST